jgi:hypothetical protein
MYCRDVVDISYSMFNRGELDIAKEGMWLILYMYCRNVRGVTYSYSMFGRDVVDCICAARDVLDIIYGRGVPDVA